MTKVIRLLAVMLLIDALARDDAAAAKGKQKAAAIIGLNDFE